MSGIRGGFSSSSSRRRKVNSLYCGRRTSSAAAEGTAASRLVSQGSRVGFSGGGGVGVSLTTPVRSNVGLPSLPILHASSQHAYHGNPAGFAHGPAVPMTCGATRIVCRGAAAPLRWPGELSDHGRGYRGNRQQIMQAG